MSALNGTKMGAEKAFHTQDPTINEIRCPGHSFGHHSYWVIS